MTTRINRYRPGRRRAIKPLFARGRHRTPSALVAVNPGYILGMAGGALFASAAILASAVGLLP